MSRSGICSGGTVPTGAFGARKRSASSLLSRSCACFAWAAPETWRRPDSVATRTLAAQDRQRVEPRYFAAWALMGTPQSTQGGAVSVILAVPVPVLVCPLGVVVVPRAAVLEFLTLRAFQPAVDAHALRVFDHHRIV